MDFNGPPGSTPLSPEDIDGLKFKHVTTRSQLDELEAANITQGLQWLKRQKPPIVSDSFIRECHLKLFGGVWIWAGTFRRLQTNIGMAFRGQDTYLLR